MTLDWNHAITSAIALFSATFGYWQFKRKTEADQMVEQLKLKIEDKRVENEAEAAERDASNHAWTRLSGMVEGQDQRIAKLEKDKETLALMAEEERRECSRKIEIAREEMETKLRKLRIESDADQSQLRDSIRALQRLCGDQETQIQGQQIIIERLQHRRGPEQVEQTIAGTRRLTDPLT